MSKENICVFNEREACSLQDRLGRADCGGTVVAETSQAAGLSTKRKF